MPNLTVLFRLARPARSLPPLAVFILAGLAAPAAAEDAALPYDLPASADTTLATGEDEQAAYFQNTEIDENILLPPARPQDDDPER